MQAFSNDISDQEAIESIEVMTKSEDENEVSTTFEEHVPSTHRDIGGRVIHIGDGMEVLNEGEVNFCIASVTDVKCGKVWFRGSTMRRLPNA